MTQKNVNGLMLKSFSRSLVSLCLHRHASYQEVDLAGVMGDELGRISGCAWTGLVKSRIVLKGTSRQISVRRDA